MFRNIVSHTRQRERLLQDIQHNNISHAYLFAGPRHVGKFTVAKWFAWEMLCACGGDRQEMARLLERNIHPDVLVLDRLYIEEECMDWGVIAASSNVPQEGRARRKARTDTIHIDDVRAIQDRLYETSTSGVKILLVRSLERLQEEAGNAFLKILEDPPSTVVFLCTTQSLSAVLPTVRSRMRIHLFSPSPPEELQPLLAEFPPNERSFLMSYAQGAAGRLIRCREDKAQLKKQRRFAEQALQVFSSSDPSLLYNLFLNLPPDDEQTFLTHLLLSLRQRMHESKQEDQHKLVHQKTVLLHILRCLQQNVQRELLYQYLALAMAGNRQQTTHDYERTTRPSGNN